MTAKISASADGTKALIGNAAEDALQIDSVAKTIKAVAPYLLFGTEVVTNSAGTCIKFPDGSMIFFGRITFTPAAFTGGPDIWYSEVTGAFTFPVAFIAAPMAQIGVLDQNISLRSAYCSFASVTASGIPSCYLTSPAPANPGVAPIILTCIAFGRWKA